ncbi:mucin-2 isoform X2 [Betta splendens]|nr:mucin-2 isoform X2 [Betta splendens]
MLSSTVVSVLAPHWSGRRRGKRLEETNASEAQGSPGVANTLNRAQQPSQSQRLSDGLFTDGSQDRPRVPPLGSRSHTAGWSSSSGPASLNYDCQRKMTQTVSLDVNSGRLDNKSGHTAASPLPLLHLNPNEQAGPSMLGSKPATGTSLLTLRRSNVLFSSLPLNKDTEDKQSQMIGWSKSSLTSSKHSFQNKAPSDTNQFPELPARATHSSFDSTLKEPLFFRRTILTSKSWWKQDVQEDGFPPTTGDAAKVTDTHSPPTDPPRRDHSDVASALPNDSQGFTGSTSSNRDNSNTTESVCRSNTNLAMKTQGGLHNELRATDSPDHRSDPLVRQLYGSHLKTREPQEPHGLTSTLSSSINTPLTPTKDFKLHESNGCISENLPRPTLLNPTSSASPTERSSTFNLNPCSPRSYSLPTSPHQSPSDRQASPSATSQADYTSAVAPNTNSSAALHSHPVSSQPSKHTLLHTGSPFQAPSRTSPSPLGFERTYASLPKPFRPKPVSSLIPSVTGFTKNHTSPVSTASISSSTTAATTVPSLYLTSPSAIKTTPTAASVSSLLTPPATPVGHNCADISSPTLSINPEKDPKKGEGKRVRRVTWNDSVDLQHPGSVSLEKPDQVPTNPLSPSRSPRNVSTPSIFSFLRSNSPNKTTSPLRSPSPKTSSIQVRSGEKFRSLSSDSADLKCREQERTRHRPSDAAIFNQDRQDLPTHRQERTQSVEADAGQSHPSAPLSLPPDFPSGYKLRYSSPPYTSLVSNRSMHGETRARALRPPLFQDASRSIYSSHPSSNTDPAEVKLLPTSKSPTLPVGPTQPLCMSLKNKMPEHSEFELLQADEANSNHSRKGGQSHHNGQVSLVNNRVHITSRSLDSDAHDSTFVTETLVYSIKPKVGAPPPAPARASPAPSPSPLPTNTKASVETKRGQQPHRGQRAAEAHPQSHSDQSSSGSSSTESQQLEGEGWGKKMKATVLGKSRFFSMESPSEQSQKKSRFALKKSVSSPNPSLLRSDSERSNRPNNKVDQVLNKLRQTFSNKRSDDDASFPWKWRRASHTPSLSGSSDTTTGSSKTLEEREDRGTEGAERWAPNKYTIVPPSPDSRAAPGDQFSAGSDRDGLRSDSKPQVHVTVHSPAAQPFDYYSDSGATNHFLFCRDPPGRSGNPPACYPAQCRKSTSSPRSPFSPFSSLSPLSPFSSPDVTDDSVFYSPKLQRRRESPSPCDPGEGLSLGASRRSRASTGPPSPGHAQGSQHFASSYADLKYGIEPGRSFSVSSVLSSRASKPGRISTGSRIMSVGDLSESVLTCAGAGGDRDRGSYPPAWTTGQDCQPAMNLHLPSDPGKVRSRSLPRSLTLANWSSGVSICHPAPAASSRSARLWSPNMNPCHFAWDAEAPPTPPPTPPLSPVSRRISKASSQASPPFSSSPGSPQSADSQTSRGHRPSRGYVSSLSTFEESSDSSSDTTTDDEYYLETGEEEKETEL